MSSLQLLCLICDGHVEAGRQGNLVTGDGRLRERLEKVVGSGLEGSARCVSLCENCESSVCTIEEYYRHVEHFRTTFASTLAKYGETLLASQPSRPGGVESEPAEKYPGEQGSGEAEVQVGGSAGSGPSWTICLQAEDGSLVPIQQGAPLVMADDHQVVLETVTVESSETQHQVVVQEEEPQSGGNHGNYEAQTEGSADNMILHPNVTDHTGMALTNETTPEGNNDEADSEPPPKPLYTCARCGAQFELAEDLVTHERNEGHLGGYNYKCGVCGNIYARLDSLRDHMCRHTGQKPHQCGLCGERFSFRNQLSRHRTTHYQLQPNNATVDQQKVVPQAFISTLVKEAEGMTAQLVEGTATETGDVAQEPGKALVMNEDISSQLQNMLNSNELQLVQMNSGELQLVAKQCESSESSLACPKCNEGFSTRFLLERHQCPSLSQSAMSQFECPKCSASFIKRSFLERHRCPSLFYPLQKAEPEDTTQEAVEMPTAEVDSSQHQPNENEAHQSNETEVYQPSKTEVHQPNEPDVHQSNETEEHQLSETGVHQPNEPDVHQSNHQPSETEGLQLNETESLSTIVNDGALVPESFDDSSAKGDEAVPTGDGAQEHGTKESTEDSVEITLKIDDKPSFIDESTENPSEVTMDTKENTDVKDVVKDVGQPLKIEEGTDSEMMSSGIRRRSIRAAGKVNPILQMLKKKSSTKDGKADSQPTAGMKATSEADTSKDGYQGVVTPGSVTTIFPCLKKQRGRPRKIRPQDSAITFTVSAAEPIVKEPGTPEIVTDEPAVLDKAKNKTVVSFKITSEPTPISGQVCPPKKRGRGRPRKYPLPEEEVSSPKSEERRDEDADVQNVLPVKRKRGRPQKFAVPQETDESFREEKETLLSLEEPKESPPRKKRGRPRKVPIVEHDAETNVNNTNLQQGKVLEETSENQNIESGRGKRIIKKRVLIDHVEEGSDSETEIEEERKDQKEEKRKQEEKKELKEEEKEQEVTEEEVTPEPPEETNKGEDNENFVPIPKKQQGIRRDFQKVQTDFKCVQCDRFFGTAIALEKHKESAIHKRGLNTPENRVFKCKVCGRGFTKLENLRDHGVNHSTELRYECVVCMKKFKFRSQLALHRNREHSTGAITEAMRKKGQYRGRERYKNSHLPPIEEQDDPRYQPDMVSIMDGEPNKKMYRCKFCLQTFTEMRLFNRHIVSHYSVKPFKCDICSKEFARADTLRNHTKVHYFNFEQADNKVFLCDTCGRQFSKVESLRNHVKMHFGERAWTCDECGKGFTDKYTLSRHVVIHKAEKPYLCATCGRGFNRKSHLEAHEAQHTGKTLYKCEICERGFSDQGNLGRHMLVHSDARPWACSVCGDTFKRKGNLDEHELTHSTERGAVCDVCGARFTTKRYLRIHQLIHSGDRPHQCTVCKASFRQLSALITHRRIHTGDAPYKCQHCEKRFKYYDQWKAHEFSHMDAKPYKCMLCSATYRQAGSLRQHRKVVHGNQKGMVFLCTVCNKTFASTISLERHMKKVHGAEASLQSIQAIGQEVMTAAGTNETSNIVQITNPQGAIETIELANLPTDGSTATNVIELLSGQTLSTLQNNEVSVGGEGGVEFSQGHRIVQLVGGLDTSPHMVQVSTAGAGTEGNYHGEVITIDSMGNITNRAMTDSNDTVVPEAEGALQYDSGTQQTLVHITNGQSVFVDTTGAEMDHGGNQHPSEDGFADIPHQVPKEEDAGDEGQVQQVQTLRVDTDTNQLSVVSITPQQLAQINTAAAAATADHTVMSNSSLLPLGIEVVPIETTVTTMATSQHHQLVTMATKEEAPNTMHEIDIQGTVIQEADVIQDANVIQDNSVIQDASQVICVESDVIHEESDIIHAGNDIIHVAGDVIHSGTVQSDVVYEGSDVIYTGNDIIQVGSDVIHVTSDVMHDNGDIITETVPHELTEQEVVETVSIATSYDHVQNM